MSQVLFLGTLGRSNADEEGKAAEVAVGGGRRTHRRGGRAGGRTDGRALSIESEVAERGGETRSCRVQSVIRVLRSLPMQGHGRLIC